MSPIRSHDFRHAETIDRAYLRTLNAIFDAFARHASIDLSTQTRHACELAFESLAERPWRDAGLLVGERPYVVTFGAHPLPGQGALILPVEAAMRILELRLGGGDSAPYDGHLEPTETDYGLLGPVFQSLLDELARSMARAVPIHARVVNQESSLQFVQFASPAEMCLWASFSLHTGGDEPAACQVCLPFPAVRQLVDLLREASRPPEDTGGDAIAQAVLRVPIEVRLEVPPVELAPLEAAALQPGDVVPLHHPKDRPFDVRAGNVLVARARPGRVGSKVVCSIVEEVSPA
ncbi:MAG TPA: flagellar motor switch protein FliM [Acidimicrobiales bacterium]|nr:flagellar motor switch protein FliM [Acidimicrobiales bacterium]